MKYSKFPNLNNSSNKLYIYEKEIKKVNNFI